MNISGKKWFINLRPGLILLSAAVISLAQSCKKPEEVVGTVYRVADSGFEVLSFNAVDKPVNFTKDSAWFSAKFSEPVTYYLRLTGKQSGAVKELSGMSDTINPAEVYWKGNHDGLKFFHKGEQVYAELTFLNSPVRVIDSFTITETKKYDGIILFGGFESGSFAWGADQEFSFPEDGGEEAELVWSNIAVQGTKSFQLKGKDNNKTYFIAGVRSQKADNSKDYFKFGTTNPDSVYFNFYVYGDGNTTTRAAIGVSEDDNLSGLYEDGKIPSEDVWEYAFKITWTGWRLMSIKYSDFTIGSDPAYGSTGNLKKELDRVKKISINVLSDPPGNPASYLVDFPIITIGKPFNPHE